MSNITKAKEMRRHHVEIKVMSMNNMMDLFEQQAETVSAKIQSVKRKTQAVAEKIVIKYSVIVMQRTVRKFLARLLLRRMRKAVFLCLWLSFRFRQRKIYKAANKIKFAIISYVNKQRYFNYKSGGSVAMIIQRFYRYYRRRNQMFLTASTLSFS